MSQPEKHMPDARVLIAGLRAYLESAMRSGLKLAGAPAAAQPAAGTSVHETLEAVREDLGECSRCLLCSARTSIVFGQGNPRARLVFVGQAPSADDDAAGLPFCGTEGDLLTRIIHAMNLERGDVYITHIVKCAPPSDRLPQDDEIRVCRPFLLRQLTAIGPSFVCALGPVAAQALLACDDTFENLRGRFHRLGRMLIMPTHAPSFLLEHQDMKRQTWNDMQLIMREYNKSGAQ